MPARETFRGLRRYLSAGRTAPPRVPPHDVAQTFLPAAWRADGIAGRKSEATRGVQGLPGSGPRSFAVPRGRHVLWLPPQAQKGVHIRDGYATLP